MTGTGILTLLLKDIENNMSGRSRISGGGSDSPFFGKIWLKLYENEENWAGGAYKKFVCVDPPLITYQYISKNHLALEMAFCLNHKRYESANH